MVSSEFIVTSDVRTLQSWVLVVNLLEITNVTATGKPNSSTVIELVSVTMN